MFIFVFYIERCNVLHKPMILKCEITVFIDTVEKTAPFTVYLVE